MTLDDLENLIKGKAKRAKIPSLFRDNRRIPSVIPTSPLATDIFAHVRGGHFSDILGHMRKENSTKGTKLDILDFYPKRLTQPQRKIVTRTRKTQASRLFVRCDTCGVKIGEAANPSEAHRVIRAHDTRQHPDTPDWYTCNGKRYNY